MQRTIERIRRRMANTQRYFVIGISVFGLALIIVSMMTGFDLVTVQDPAQGTEVTVLTTAGKETDELLTLAGVETRQEDEVVVATRPDEGSMITVNRAFPVHLAADGEVFTAELASGTVADLLDEAGVEVGPDDIISHTPDTELVRDLEVTVDRVEFEEESIRSEVLADELDEYLGGLTEEEQNAFLKSKSRIYDVTYQNRYVNGELAEREILSLTAVYHPYDDPSAAFEPGVPVSTIDRFDGVEIGEDGIPTEYSRKMSSAVATAYSASGGKGAGGQGLYCGTVAVNPNVIPYGTRMYITAADGSFVYGYAIASDCGTAMMEGRVDVDLYFESNAECRKFGKRSLDIYILD